MKTCYICKQNLDFLCFYPDSYSEDGFTTSCKVCQRIKSKEYYSKKKSALTDQQKAARKAAYAKWKAQNPERYAALTQKHNKK